MSQSILLPGEALPQASSKAPQSQLPGTHLYNNTAHASLAGILTSSKTTTAALQRPPGSTTPALPYVGATVLARVLRCTPRQAIVAILTVDNRPLASSTSLSSSAASGTASGSTENYQGLIRVQDVRATEKDKVRIAESFRPGDVVRAEVISLGDQSSFYLSTARNELGVVIARSENEGRVMAPVSWKEMVDVESGVREARKVAKVA